MDPEFEAELRESRIDLRRRASYYAATATEDGFEYADVSHIDLEGAKLRAFLFVVKILQRPRSSIADLDLLYSRPLV